MTRLRRLWARLRSAERRMHCCAVGEHRETIECAFGIMRTRCLDCDKAHALGFVFVGVSNRRRSPWEPEGA